MTENENTLPQSGIKFFGKMSASATHEIKNTLAIINENAGLLEDLAIMSEKSTTLSPSRVVAISKKITTQVKRADQILRRLNQFSHSVDHPFEFADLEQTVTFVLNMSYRIISMQGISINITPPVSPQRIHTNLFYLKNLIWRAIDSACKASGEKKNIMISFGTDKTEPTVWFSIDCIKEGDLDHLFCLKEDKKLIKDLNVTYVKHKKNSGFGLVWPEPSKV